MAIVDDTFLQDMSDLATDLALKDSCEILDKGARVSDGQGGSVPNWAVATMSPCLVADAGAPQEIQVAEQVSNRVVKTIYFPRATAVKKDHRLRVNGAETYRVIDLYDPTTYEVLRRVAAIREEFS